MASYFLENFHWTWDLSKGSIYDTLSGTLRLIVPTDFSFPINSKNWDYPDLNSACESRRLAFIFVVKIFLGFGIYQTIQALRNLGRS